MEIRLTDEEARSVGEASRLIGVNDRETVTRALISYLDHLKESKILEKETECWDDLSDEALVNFESHNE